MCSYLNKSGTNCGMFNHHQKMSFHLPLSDQYNGFLLKCRALLIIKVMLVMRGTAVLPKNVKAPRVKTLEPALSHNLEILLFSILSV